MQIEQWLEDPDNGKLVLSVAGKESLDVEEMTLWVLNDEGLHALAVRDGVEI